MCKYFLRLIFIVKIMRNQEVYEWTLKRREGSSYTDLRYIYTKCLMSLSKQLQQLELILFVFEWLRWLLILVLTYDCLCNMNCGYAVMLYRDKYSIHT